MKKSIKVKRVEIFPKIDLVMSNKLSSDIEVEMYNTLIFKTFESIDLVGALKNNIITNIKKVNYE